MNPTPRRSFSYYVLPVACAVFYLSVAPLSRDGDLWLHLRMGEFTLKHLLDRQGLLWTDIFSFTAVGRPNEVHSWLGQIVLWIFYHFGKDTGLRILHGLLLMFTLVPVERYVFRKSQSSFWAAVAVSLGLLLHREIADIKPSLFGEAMFSIFVFEILFRRRKDPMGTVRLSLLFALPLVWINLHGSGILPLPLVLLWALGNFFRGWREALYPVLLVAVAILINPLFDRVYAEAASLAVLGRSLSVVEWTAAEWLTIQDRGLVIPITVSNFLLFALIFAIGLELLVRRKSETGFRMLNYVGWSILAIYSRRSAIYLTFPFAIAVAEWGAFVDKRFDSGLRPPVRQLTAMAFFILVFWAGQIHVAPSRIDLPERATAFLEESGITGNAFNDQPWGGYLAFRLYPHVKVGIDSRIAVHRDTAKILIDAKGADGLVDLPGVLRRIPESEILVHQSRIPLRRWLGSDWIVVFENNLSTVAIKRGPAASGNLERIAKYYEHFRIPFDDKEGFVFASAYRANPEWVSRFQENWAHGVTTDGNVIAAHVIGDADFYLTRGLDGLAYALLKQSTSQYPDDWRIAVRYGELLAQLGRESEAREWLATLEARKVPRPAQIPLRTALRNVAK